GSAVQVGLLLGSHDAKKRILLEPTSPSPGTPMATVIDRNALLSVTVTSVQPTIGEIRLLFLLVVEICRLLAQRAE
ncbi:hypothetical protein P3406_24085, partial [Vibrio parahaemolyticus]|nr:hypothetical protein [Vibrio parahaemolyticus]